MVSAGERTPDYGHTPASLVNGEENGGQICFPQL
jgi:hypothetical protein